MIYKLFNYLKSVSIESEEGIQTLTHEGKYYQNDHVCLEVQEVNHNEIQFKVVNADCEIKHIYVDFINPIENVKAHLMIMETYYRLVMTIFYKINAMFILIGERMHWVLKMVMIKVLIFKSTQMRFIYHLI